MSIFSIIQNAQEQQFSLQMKGRGINLPDTREPSEEAEDKEREKAVEKAVTLAKGLIETTSASQSQSQEDTEASGIFKDFKDAVDLNSTISRAIKDSADTEREARIDRISQEIGRMKETLKFATPEKAEKMLKELQQLAKLFRTATVELGRAAAKMGPDTPNRVVDVAADATAFAIDRQTGGAQAAQADLMETVAEVADALLSAGFGAASPGEVPAGDTSRQQAGTLQAATPQTATPQTTAPKAAGPTATDQSGTAQSDQAQSGPAQSGAPLQAADQDGTAVIAPAEDPGQLFRKGEHLGYLMHSLQSSLHAANDAAFQKAAVYAYAEFQHQSDSLYRQGRKETMRAEHETLMKVFEELKNLAKSLESLLDMEDEDTRERVIDVWKKLEDGLEILEDDDLQQFLGAGRFAPAGRGEAGAGTVSSSLVMSSVSVETSVSITISAANIVA